MNIKIKIINIIIVSTFCFGCQTVEQAKKNHARDDIVKKYNEEQIIRLQGDIELVEEEQDFLKEDIEGLKKQISDVLKDLIDTQNTVRKNYDTLVNIEKILSENKTKNFSEATISGREHVVELGHTLSVIAQAYDSTVSAIKDANNLNTDKIYVGQKLIIPD